MKIKFIAEVSSNHNRDLERSKEFIRTSSLIGCQAVKFQLFKVDELFAPEVVKANKEIRKRKNWELPVEYIPVLSEYAHSLGLEFSCTPFYLDAVDELNPFVDFYKIASYEILWLDLLKKIAATGKTVVASTGMATMEEIISAVETIRNTGNHRLSLLHCISGYPTPPEQANLKAIKTLKDQFNCSVGWSDHTVNPGVLYRAVYKWNAELVEFHLDLEGTGEEYKTGHCWLPNEIKPVISQITKGFEADGNGEKNPAPSEMPDRDWRADPADGLRPLMNIRKNLSK